jgi:molybdopterin/thiamine biosynthesis adenylyltransferase
MAHAELDRTDRPAAGMPDGPTWESLGASEGKPATLRGMLEGLGIRPELIRTHEDERTLWAESDGTDAPDIAGLTAPLSPESRQDIDRAFGLQMAELHRVRPDVGDTAGPGIWVRSAEGRIARILPEREFTDVFLSRERPFFTSGEWDTLHRANVLFLGLSTGSPVFEALVKLGVGSRGGLIGADPDYIELSNLSRLSYGGIYDIGKLKGDVLARTIAEKNPYHRFATVSDALTPAALERLIGASDVVVEMVDDLGAKLQVRSMAEAASRPGRYVAVATAAGKDFEPSFSVGALPSELLDMLRQGPPGADMVSRIRWIVLASGPMPERQLTHFLLSASGREPFFIGQTGLTAMTVGGMLAFEVTQLLLGRQVKSSVDLSLYRSILSDKTEIVRAEGQFLASLQARYPDLYPRRFRTLLAANRHLAKSLLGLTFANGRFTANP